MADRGRNGMDHWPVANHIVNDKFREYCMRKHYERISSVRPTIDTEAPMEYFHMKYNARKAMREAERLHEIEQENRILLEKMLKIASHDPWKHNKSWRLRPTTGYKRGMYYDPVRQSLFTDHINIPGSVRLKGGQAKYRKEQELLRITKDNLVMLERIQQVKAHYSHSKMEGGHVEDLRRREQLTKFRGPEQARYMSPGFKCVNSRVLSEDAAKKLDNLKTAAGEEAKLAFSRSMSRRIPLEDQEGPTPEPEPKPESQPEEKKPLFGSGFRFSGAVMKVLQTIRPNKPADKFSNAVDMVKFVTKMRKRQENKVMNNMSRTSRLAAGLSGNLGVEEEGPKKKTVKVDKKLAAYATPIQPQLKTTFSKSYNDLNRSWSTKVRYVDTSTAPSAATSRKTSRAPSVRGDDEDNTDLFADV